MNRKTVQAPPRPDDRPDLRALYRMALLIRRAEEKLSQLFAAGEVPGFIHLSIGQEAVSAGVMANLANHDTIASTHRGHGHALAKGMPLDAFFAELLGREAGLCRGRGGSMHVADFSVGMLGANGIVAAGCSIALGSALAHKLLKHDNVAVAFFGDGALAEGVLHETLNMSKLLQLPLIMVCENNGWSEFSRSQDQLAFTFEKLIHAYGIPYHSADGNDLEQVAQLSKEVIASVRAGGGPQALECHTNRVRGHFEGDPQKYRNADDGALAAERDPLRIAAERLADEAGGAEWLDQVASEVDEELDAALARASESAEPEFEDALRDVYCRASIAR